MPYTNADKQLVVTVPLSPHLASVAVPSLNEDIVDGSLFTISIHKCIVASDQKLRSSIN